MHEGVRAVVALTIVSMVFVYAFGAGCKKKEKPAGPGAAQERVVTNRMNDAAYLAALQQNRAGQMAQASARHSIVTQMQACVKRVQATLAADADEVVLKAALARDQEWQRLEALNKKALDGILQTLGDARDTIRKRMMEEARANKAVAQGQAKAVNQAQPRREE